MLEMRKTFPGKKPDDKIVVFAKKHWIKYALIIGICLLLCIPVLVLLISLALNYMTLELSYAIILTFGVSAYLLVALALIFHAFVDYYLDVLIVTEERIIYVRQNGYLFQQVDEVHLQDIEEVGVDLKGIWRSFFNYGNIVIHSGSDIGVLNIDSVKDPKKIARIIMDLHKEHLERSHEEKDEKKELEIKEL